MENVETDTCDSCGAEIVWVRPIKEDGDLGKWMPLSVESREKRYAIVKGGQRATTVPTFVSHFADCPDADEHRKGAADE